MSSESNNLGAKRLGAKGFLPLPAVVENKARTLLHSSATLMAPEMLPTALAIRWSHLL